MTRQVFTDPVLSDVLSQLSGALADKRVNIESWNRDRSKIAISAAEPGRPADYYVFDRGAGALGPIGSAASHLAEAATGHCAALKIQAQVRRRQARSTVQGMRAARAAVAAAATAMGAVAQAAALVVGAEAATGNCAALKIQGLVRGHIVRAKAEHVLLGRSSYRLF